MAADTSLVVSETFTVPLVAEGVYYIGIMTDVLNYVAEQDESNNIQYSTGTVIISNDQNIPNINVSPASLTINENAGNQSLSPAIINITGKSKKADYVKNQLIVKFKSNVGNTIQTLNITNSDLEALNHKYKTKIIKRIAKSMHQLNANGNGNTLLFQIESESDIFKAIEELKKIELVEYAEPNYIMLHNSDIKSAYTPSDPYFVHQWGLKNTGNAIYYTGMTVGTTGEDINIEPAWDITLGSSDIIVAVIDDGVDLSHSEFSGRLVDGYDFVNDDTDPYPLLEDGHGNACAGIIAAADNGNGIVGVAPMVNIMPIKSMEDGSGFTSDIADGIYYAVDNSARVISMSLGGTEFSYTLETAINYAVDNGVIVIARAFRPQNTQHQERERELNPPVEQIQDNWCQAVLRHPPHRRARRSHPTSRFRRRRFAGRRCRDPGCGSPATPR